MNAILVWKLLENFAVDVAVEWLVLLLLIWKVPGSGLGPETGFLTEGFRGFSDRRQILRQHVKSSFYSLSNSVFIAFDSDLIY
jgi:hypothetical protein